jgi:putative chitinase
VGDQQDYGARIYDPRVGRFLSRDPLSLKYPMLTPYQFASDRPIDGVDQDGLEYISTADANISSAEKNKDNTYTLKIGDQTIKSPGTVSYNGNDYYNIGQNLYKTDKGISLTGTSDQKITSFFVTEDQMKSIFSGAKASVRNDITNSLNTNMNSYGVDSYKKLSQFLGQAGEETWGLTTFSEDLNRSYKNLCSHCKEGSEISDNTGAYVNNPTNYGNLVYANSSTGNGNVASGDGFKFRGRGLLQLTGKGNYQSFNNFYDKKYGTGPNFMTNADLIATNMNYATISGLWFFSNRVGNKLDLNNASVEKVTRRVNG